MGGGHEIMSKEVEERIVQMRFENAQFEKGAKQSLITLDKLDSILDRLGSGGGLDKINSALDTLQTRFSLFGVAGMAAVQKITNSVIDLAARMLTAIPKQIISGGTTRASNIERAKFQLEGLKVAWEDVSDDIDYAVKDTAYGLDEAAVAAAQFAASLGHDSYKNAAGEISDMGKALRAISGVAGMTNSSYGEIANIFTGIAGTGHVMTQDLRMLEGRGLNVAAKLAEVLSDGPDHIKYTEKQIREMVSKGEIDFLTFAKAMDYAFGDHAKKANETYTGSLANMKAALSRIGADFVTPIHKGLTSVQNALRLTFDRLRTITKPFAENEFTNWMERASSLAVKLADSVNFEWVKPLLDLAGSGLNAALDAANSLYRLFRVRHEVEGLVSGDDVARGSRHFWIDKSALARVENLRKGFAGLIDILKTVGDFAGLAFKKMFGDSRKNTRVLDSFLKKFGELGESFSNLRKKHDGFKKQFEQFFKNISRVASPAVRALKAGVELLALAFRNLFQSGRDSGTFSRLGDIFQWLWDKIGTATEKLAGWLETMRDYIREHGTFVGSLDGLGEKFGVVGDTIADVTNRVKEFLRNLFGLEEGQTLMDKYGEFFQGAGERIRGAMSRVREGISGLFTENGIGTEAIKIAAAFYSVLIGYRKLESTKFAMGRVGKAFQFIKKLLTGAYNAARSFNPEQWAGDIETILRRSSGALRAFGDNLNAKSLVEIGKAVLVLSIGLGILAKVGKESSWADLRKAFTALTVIIGELTVAMFALSRMFGAGGVLTSFGKGIRGFFTGIGKFIGNSINRLFNIFALQQAAKALIYLAVSVGILVLALGGLVYISKKANGKELGLALGILAGMILILVGAMWALAALSKGGNVLALTGITVAFIGLSIGIAVLLGAIWALSKIPYEDLQKGLGAVAVGIIVLVAAVLVLGRVKAKAVLGALALIELSVAILILAAAIWVISKINLEGLGEKMGYFILIFVAVAVALALLSLLNPISMIAAGLAMIMVAGAITVLAVAFGVFALIPAAKLSKITKKIIIALVGLTSALAVLTLLGPGVLAAGAALLMAGLGILAVGAGFASFASGLPVLATGLNMLDGLDLKAIGKGLGSLAWGLTKLGAGGAIASLGDGGFAALLPLASAMELMQNLDYETLTDRKKGLPALGSALGKLGRNGVWLGLGDGGLMASALGFSGLASGLNEMMPALKEFGQLPNIDAMPDQIKALGDAIKNFGKGAKRSDDILEVGQALSLIVPAISQMPEDAAEKVQQIGEVIGNAIPVNQEAALTAVQSLMDEMVKVVESSLVNFETQANNIPFSLINGIEKFRQLPISKIRYVTNDMANELDGRQSDWEILGGNIAVGIANGITGKTADAVRAMSGLASSIQKTFTVSLQIRSPSRVMERLSEYIPAGIARGIQNGSGEVENSVEYVVAPILAALQALMESNDFQPVITPVVDLTNVDRAAGTVGSLFGRTHVRHIDNIASSGIGMGSSSEAIVQDNGAYSREVADQVRGLGSKLDLIGMRLENMQVVLDDGTLVGKMSAPLDRQLSKMYARKGRGN